MTKIGSVMMNQIFGEDGIRELSLNNSQVIDEIKIRGWMGKNIGRGGAIGGEAGWG